MITPLKIDAQKLMNASGMRGSAPDHSIAGISLNQECTIFEVELVGRQMEECDARINRVIFGPGNENPA